jgi:membrane-associated protein
MLVDRVMQLLADFNPAMLALVTILFTMMETTALLGLLVPGDIVVLLAGSTAATPHRFAVVLGAAALGTFTGEMLGYTFGRKMGPRLRTSRFGRRVGRHQRWERAERYLSGKGARVLVPVRFVSVLHAIAPVVAGTAGMPLRRFASWAGLGALVWATTYTSVGALAGGAYRKYGNLGLLTSVFVIVSASVLWTVRAKRRAPAAPTSTVDVEPALAAAASRCEDLSGGP